MALNQTSICMFQECTTQVGLQAQGRTTCRRLLVLRQVQHFPKCEPRPNCHLASSTLKSLTIMSAIKIFKEWTAQAYLNIHHKITLQREQIPNTQLLSSNDSINRAVWSIYKKLCKSITFLIHFILFLSILQATLILDSKYSSSRQNTYQD